MADSVYDVVGAFQGIEEELIASMQRNMKRHIGEEYQESINWTQWQAEMLNGLAQYRQENSDRLKGYYSTINESIEATIRQAYATGESEQEISILRAIQEGYQSDRTGVGTNAMEGAFFKINERKLNALINATNNDFQKAEHSILRRTEDIYRQTIFNAQMRYNSGASTLWQAVDMASRDFMAAGINSIQYSNGARVNIASYAEMALRTANKRANLMGQAQKREEYGIHLVEVSSHASACPKCVEWQGQVYVDDVYGSGTEKESKQTGYPMLSESIGGGMFHPNCKNGCSTFYEGISTPPKEPTQEEKEEMVRRYNLEQEQRKCERNIRKYNRLSAGSLDADNVAKYNAKMNEWKAQYNKLIRENPDVLRKEPARLKLYGIGTIEKGSTGSRTKPTNRNYNSDFAQKFGKDHYNAYRDIIEKNENKTLKAVWDKCESQLSVGDANCKRGAYAMGHDIYLNINNVAKGDSISKPYQTLFHESGHGIDSLNRHLGNSDSYFARHLSSAYKDGAYYKTIKQEVNDWVTSHDKQLKKAFKDHAGDVEWFYKQGHISKWDYSKYKDGTYSASDIIPKYRKSMAYNAAAKELRSHDALAVADLCDIIEGATNGKISVVAGHGKKYWADRTRDGIHDGLATEAFAEMTDSALGNKESLEIIQKYLPESYKIYLEMLEVILNG